MLTCLEVFEEPAHLPGAARKVRSCLGTREERLAARTWPRPAFPASTTSWPAVFTSPARVCDRGRPRVRARRRWLLQYAMDGVSRGEPVLYVTLSETEEELCAGAESHGWTLYGIDIRVLTPREERARRRRAKHDVPPVGSRAERRPRSRFRPTSNG